MPYLARSGMPLTFFILDRAMEGRALPTTISKFECRHASLDILLGMLCPR